MDQTLLSARCRKTQLPIYWSVDCAEQKEKKVWLVWDSNLSHFVIVMDNKEKKLSLLSLWILLLSLLLLLLSSLLPLLSRRHSTDWAVQNEMYVLQGNHERKNKTKKVKKIKVCKFNQNKRRIYKSKDLLIKCKQDLTMSQ